MYCTSFTVQPTDQGKVFPAEHLVAQHVKRHRLLEQHLLLQTELVFSYSIKTNSCKM